MIAGQRVDAALSRSVALYAERGVAGRGITQVLSPGRLPDLFVRWVGPGFRFRLVEAARVVTRWRVVDLPAWFEFDAASVPRVVWTILSPVDLGVVAPAVHDYLYQTGGDGGRWTRGEADALFRVHMKAEGVTLWKRTAAWAAVRVAGWRCWQKAPEAARKAAPTGGGGDGVDGQLEGRPAPSERRQRVARVRNRTHKRRRGWA